MQIVVNIPQTTVESIKILALAASDKMTIEEVTDEDILTLIRSTIFAEFKPKLIALAQNTMSLPDARDSTNKQLLKITVSMKQTQTGG